MEKVDRADQIRRNNEAILEIYKDSANRGDQRAVLQAIAFCASAEIIPPGWAAEAFCKAVGKVVSLRATSWDDAFGSPYKGRKVEQLRIERRISADVAARVWALRSKGMSAEKAYMKVAEESYDRFGVAISARTAKRYFDDWSPQSSNTPKVLDRTKRKRNR